MYIGAQADKKGVQWTVFPPNYYSGLPSKEMRRLRAFEDDNARLKEIVADLTLDRQRVSV